jgi:hypothetical protein
MRKLIGRVLLIPKATVLALALLLPVLSVSLFPVNAFAEEPAVETPNQIATPAESPTGVEATTEANNKTIVWTWNAPASGLTPDAGTVVVDENGNPVDPQPTERSTDIIGFGYELVKDGQSITAGVVNFDILTVTTTVTDNGDYTLYVWSITRAGGESAKSAGYMAVFIPIPNLPPINEEDIPLPLDTTPLVTVPIVEPGGSTQTSPEVNASNNPGYVTNAPSASVLSANNSVSNPTNQVETAGVATTSTQGWVVLGIPWYYWLVVLAVSYVIVRLLYRYTVHL